MTSPVLPRLFTEIGVTPAAPVVPAGTLILNDPALGLLDTGTLYGATSWTDASPFLRTLSVVRPGTRAQGPLFTYQGATVTAVYDNTDGRFDPDNPAGPYVAGGVSQVRAMIQVRFRANWGGTDYPLIHVFADGWNDTTPPGYDDGYSEVTLTGQDAFKVLAGITLAVIAAAGAGETSGARIGRILNAASWFTDHRRVAGGDSTVQATTFGTDALSLLQLTADSELGELYADGAGNVTFRNRHAILQDTRSTTPQGVFGDVPGTSHPAGTELACSWPTRANDDITLFNDIQITAAGSSSMQESSDAASIAANLFPRTFARTDLIMTSDFEALAYAQWTRVVGASPEDRFDTITVDPLADPVNLFPQVLGRERGDRIQLWRRPQSVPPVVTLYGTGFAPAVAAAVVTSTGHTFAAVTVPGWGFGPGVAVFYTAPLPGGAIAITTVPLTLNELQPTADHAELGIFYPAPLNPSAAGPRPGFTRIVIPTTTGSLTAVTPGEAIGGTDAGGGDMQVVAGRPVFTCEGYYFSWNIPTFGLYPALGFLQNLAGQWAFAPPAANFLAGNDTGFESGTGDWVPNTNCSIAASNAQAHTGTQSLQITSSSAGDMIAASFNSALITTTGMKVLPGQEVLCAAWMRTAAASRACSAGVGWYDATGTLVSSVFGATSNNDIAAAWSQISAVLTAPASSAYCRALVKVAATGGASEIHYCDDVTLQLLGGSLTGDQWQLTNPNAFVTLQPGGISSGLGANYWSPRSPGQMAVLPNSGRVVIGHYFGTGAFTGGAISVVDANGALLTVYQLPNIVPTDGTTLTTCAVRDVEADPSSAVNDERFVIIYDAFGTGNIQGCFQEFSYNDSTQTVTPVSVPACPTDTASSGAPRVRPSYALFGPDGTLYISCGNVLNSANMSVYLKHGGGRNTVINAPVFGGWQTASWPTPVKPDYSLGFPVAQGLGALAGPMAIDPVSGAVLVPSGASRVAAAVPVTGGITALGPNLLPVLSQGFETPNIHIDDDAMFVTSLGTWIPFLATLARNTAPPVAPPKGTAVGQMTTAFASMVCNTASYPVSPGLSYMFTSNFLANTVARTMEVYIQWKDNTGTVISTSAHGTGTDNAATWTPVTTGPVTSPAGAAQAVVFVQGDSTAAGEVHYFAANSLYCLDATPTGWTGFVTSIALTSDQALDGQFSLALSSGFNNETLVATSPKAAVTAGREYLAKAWFRGKTTAEACKITLTFQDANGNGIGLASDGTLKVVDSTAGWTEAWCGALAPPGAVTAQVNLEPFAAVAGSIHYADRVSIQAQPWTAPPACDFGEGLLRTAGYAVTNGRPTVSGGYMYIPVAAVFTPAEQAAYTTSYVPDSTHPQFLAAVNVAGLLAGSYGAVAKDCFIRGIQHDIDAVAGTWLTTWTLQDATRYAGFLILDSLATGRLNVNPLAY